jgi:hypothetical protein
MKKIKTVLFFLCFSPLLHAQNPSLEGKAILKVYADFFKGLTQEDPSTAFEIKRVYLGYKGNINEHFSAEAKLDIGSPEDLSQYSLIRRYAYFKTAALKYKKDRLTIHAGLFNMLQFEKQEDAWGYRYLYKSFMDEHKFGPSADIGIGAEYKLTNYLAADIVISNGEGFKNLQSDDTFKTGIGITIFPLSHTTFRIYYDFINKDLLQSTFAMFASYQRNNYRLSYEFNRANNYDFISNHDFNGMSIYGTYILNDKWELFGRYDRLVSNMEENSEIPWNIYQDGSAIIAGIQYQVNTNINLALNYRDWYSYAQNGPDRSYIYVNLEFKL